VTTLAHPEGSGERPRRKSSNGRKDHPLNLDFDLRVHRKGPVTLKKLVAVGAGLGGLIYWILEVIRSLGK
jgi:hypothetical protein